MRAWRKFLLWFAAGAALAEAPEPLESAQEEGVVVQAPMQQSRLAAQGAG